MSKKDKLKQQQQGIPLSSSRLIKGGETGNRDDGRGRKLRRTVKDPQIAGQAVSHVTSFLSTYHGEQFVKAIPNWFQDVLNPLINATGNHGLRIMIASAIMAVINLDTDQETFESDLLPLIQRINKRVAKESMSKNLPPKRVISYSCYNPKPPSRGREHNVQGSILNYAIIICLPGHLNMPEQLTSDYAEFYLRIGNYSDLDPLTSDIWLERSRQSFNEFTENQANPFNNGDVN